MKIRQLPSGSWTTQVQINGKRKSFTHKSKTKLKDMVKKYTLAHADAPSRPLGELIDNYIDAKRNVLSPSTVERYERIRDKHFQRLMIVPADELTSERMQQEINLMAVKYSPKTIRNAYGLITATLALYAPTLKFNVTLPARQKIEYNIPTTEDVNNLVKAASPNLKTAIMLAAYCGMRRGEIVAIESSDIHGDALHVHRSAVYDSDGKIVVKQPKTYHSDRYVTMPDIVKNQIEGNEGRLCPIALSTITREFDGLRDRLGLKCRFHDLRHYFASVLHALEVPDQYIMKKGGWKSDFMLKAVYRNTLDDFELKNDKKINDFFNESANEMQTDTPQTP